MLTNAAILIVDSQKEHADVLAAALRKQFTKIVSVYLPTHAVELIDKENFDLVIADLSPGSDIDGIDILERAKQKNPSTQVILLSADAAIDSCKRAIRRGAYDYLVKPIDTDQLRIIAARAITPARPRSETDFVFAGVKSRSPAMQSVFHVLRRVSPTNIGVLIEGQSGTGKELTAKAIHENSLRKGKPFMPLNCAGLTESLLESELFGHAKGAFTGAGADRKGLFEMADRGTLFLDEIGDMPLSMQAKLLRVIEDGMVVPVGSNKPIIVDVRLISATNHNLAKLVEEQKFRQDLYFRIKGVSVTLPPLKNRREDIPELFGYFLQHACRELGRNITRITEAAMNVLINFDWPGNIRQLKHTVMMMVVLCMKDTLDIQDIPPEIHHLKRLAGQVAAPAQYPYFFAGQSLSEVEKEHIGNTLIMTNNNRAEAAKILKIGERTLYRKIKEYGL